MNHMERLGYISEGGRQHYWFRTTGEVDSTFRTGTGGEGEVEWSLKVKKIGKTVWRMEVNLLETDGRRLLGSLIAHSQQKDGRIFTIEGSSFEDIEFSHNGDSGSVVIFDFNKSYIFFVQFILEVLNEEEFMQQFDDVYLAPLNPVFNYAPDITVTAQKRKFYVHKNALSQNPVFKGIFEQVKSEGEEVPNIAFKEVNADAMDGILHYLYTGRCPHLRTHAKDILNAADTFCMEDLKKKAIKALTNQMNVHNVTDILRIADENQAQHLKEVAILFINAHRFEIKVLKEDWFSDLSSRLVADLLDALAEEGL